MKILKSACLIAALFLLAAGCTNRKVQPRFGTITCDTLLDNSRAECRIAFDFASIRNASDSPALEAIEEANIAYFFQLEEFTGSAEEALEASLEEIATTLFEEAQLSGAGGSSYEITAESTGEVVDTLLTTPFRAGVTRAACTTCTASSATPIRWRRGMNSPRRSCSEESGCRGSIR